MTTLKIKVEIGQNCSYTHTECFDVRIVMKMIKTLNTKCFFLCVAVQYNVLSLTHNMLCPWKQIFRHVDVNQSAFGL